MQKVAAIHTEPLYPTRVPFHPSEGYPEYPFSPYVSPEKNYVYEGIRQLFCLLGLDRDRYGTKDWNPLGGLIEPGMTVVLKPNFVLSRHKQGRDLYSIITHPSVLRAVIDYAWIALRGHGQIIIADAPQYDCDFRELVKATRLDEVIDFHSHFQGPAVNLWDLRRYWSRGKHFSSMLEALPGDPQGTLTVNLGRHSELYHSPHPEKLYGAVYHRSETIAHHNGEIQEYEVANTIMNADVVISIPKLKVHKKVGVTLNAKGLVGICTNKNYLVHYKIAPPSRGGDQYPDGLFNPVEETLIKTERWMYDHLLAPRSRILEYFHRSIYSLHNRTTRRLGLKVSEDKRQMDAGNWYGNDSAWRMTVDLMKLFRFADRRGQLQATQQRRMFSVIDGIIGGDNMGPLTPDPVPSGTLVAGENWLAVDLVATRLMGFDPLKLRLYQALLKDASFGYGIRSLDDIQVLSPDPTWANCLRNTVNRFLGFRPHPGWTGHLEIRPQ
jgi:uncharacterized protein (DUF362 family)